MYTEEEKKLIASSYEMVQKELEKYKTEDSALSYFNFYYDKYLKGETGLNDGLFHFNFKTGCLAGTAGFDISTKIFYIEDEYDVYIIDNFEEVFAGREILKPIIASCVVEGWKI